MTAPMSVFSLWRAMGQAAIIFRLAGCSKSAPYADVAQVVEQRIRNAWVGGSNPSVGTISL